MSPLLIFSWLALKRRDQFSWSSGTFALRIAKTSLTPFLLMALRTPTVSALPSGSSIISPS
jgi:hypothetical protein